MFKVFVLFHEKTVLKFATQRWELDPLIPYPDDGWREYDWLPEGYDVQQMDLVEALNLFTPFIQKDA